MFDVPFSIFDFRPFGIWHVVVIYIVVSSCCKYTNNNNNLGFTFCYLMTRPGLNVIIIIMIMVFFISFTCY